MPESAILIIKLGALGNVILLLNAFAAIRAHHPAAPISLLTTAPYADWLRLSPWFDDVLVDTRPGWWNLPGVRRLRRMLLRPVVVLLPVVSAHREAGMVRYRTGLLASRPGPEPRPAARQRPPDRPTPPSRHLRHSARRSVVVPRRHRPLRPAAGLRRPGARQCPAPHRQALR